MLHAMAEGTAATGSRQPSVSRGEDEAHD
jgi:hypothetical protein